MREHMPAFMQSDDEEVVGLDGGLLSGVNTRRRRRQYDERMEEDDVQDDEVGHCLFKRALILALTIRTCPSRNWATSKLPVSLNG